MNKRLLLHMSNHTWLTCFSVPMKMSFYINPLRRAKERSLKSSIYHIVTLMTLSLSRFKEFIPDIYPKELTISEITESTSVASYLDMLFTRDKNNNITIKLYDKCDASTWLLLCELSPFMSSNIPSAPAYGVYASQVICYAHCC